MTERLNKHIAAAGFCSRREADGLIAAGRVTVNGAAARLGDKVTAGDRVAVDGSVLDTEAVEKVVLAFYKPPGVTCTARDVHAERIISDVLDFPLRLTYAGRLDRDSEGLLLMSNDGLLIERLMRGSNGHEKEYLVEVDKKITPVMIEKMAAGVYLPGLDIVTRPCVAKVLGEKVFSVILTQGVNRQLRRMCAVCGYGVERLTRVRVANVGLGDLRPGEYRRVEGEELAGLERECGLSPRGRSC